ncbi:hypothetical protein B0H19DRAFT_1074108 [Mycena capillaripes]|nr:hypothetical protein B0H19DRAFT_1074108 [Mycena capillaripes]
MPALTTPTFAPTSTQCQKRRPLTILRDLGTMVTLCYLITLGLMRCIALYLDFLGPPAVCGAQVDYRLYLGVIDNISKVDVLKVTTGCSLVAFATLELCLVLARRAGIPCEAGDAEYGLGEGLSQPSQVSTEKQLEKRGSIWQYLIGFATGRDTRCGNDRIWVKPAYI